MSCYICLLHAPFNVPATINQATTTVNGTAVCDEHVSHIANHQVLSAHGMEALPHT